MNPPRPLTPDNKHFAVVVKKSKSMNHEGDERSRTHPEHYYRYPTYTEKIEWVEYIPFDGRAALDKWIVDQEYVKPKPQFQVLECMPLSASVAAVVTLMG